MSRFTNASSGIKCWHYGKPHDPDVGQYVVISIPWIATHELVGYFNALKLHESHGAAAALYAILYAAHPYNPNQEEPDNGS